MLGLAFGCLVIVTMRISLALSVSPALVCPLFCSPWFVVIFLSSNSSFRLTDRRAHRSSIPPSKSLFDEIIVHGLLALLVRSNGCHFCSFSVRFASISRWCTKHFKLIIYLIGNRIRQQINILMVQKKLREWTEIWNSKKTRKIDCSHVRCIPPGWKEPRFFTRFYCVFVCFFLVSIGPPLSWLSGHFKMFPAKWMLCCGIFSPYREKSPFHKCFKCALVIANHSLLCYSPLSPQSVCVVCLPIV